MSVSLNSAIAGDSSLTSMSRIWSWIKLIWSWIKVPVGLAALGYIYWNYRGEIEEFLSQPKDWGYLALGFSMITFSTALVIVRWYLLVWALDIPFRLRDAFWLGFVALFVNFAGPGLVGGDLYKAYSIAHGQRQHKAQAAATVLLDRILGLIPLVMLGAFASLFTEGIPSTMVDSGVRWILWGGSIGGILGLMAMLQPWFTRSIWVRGIGKLPYVGRIFVDVLNGVTLYQSRPRVLILAVLMGLVGHIVTIGGFYYCALGVRVWAPSLMSHLYFMPLAEVLGMLPSPMPGGLGPLELAVSQSYVFAAGDAAPAVARSAGLAATIAFRIVNLLLAAIGGICYISARKEVQAALAEAKV